MKWIWFNGKKKNKYTFNEFSEIIQTKLSELNFTKEINNGDIIYKTFFSDEKYTGVFTFVTIYVDTKRVAFANGLSPIGCWHSLSEYYFTNENLNYLLDLLSEISINSKKCLVQAKLNDLEKDF